MLVCLGACGRIGYSAVDLEQSESPDASVDPGDDCTSFEPFALIEAEVAAVMPAIDAFNKLCPGNCRLQNVAGFTYSPCLGQPLQLRDVVNEAIGQVQLQIQPSFEIGQVIADAGAAAPLSLTNEGAGVLMEFDRLTGSEVSEAWHYQEEIPCQNCVAFETLAVLWYRDTRWVVALPGFYGGD